MTRDLACPLCGGTKGSNVTDTRRCADAIIRMRRCFDCHSVFVTTETADPRDRREETVSGAPPPRGQFTSPGDSKKKKSAKKEPPQAA